MGFGVQIGKAADVRLVSVYCSNTAGGTLGKGKVVALRYTSTVLNPETGAGFGAAVDYAVATTSLVVGVLWGGDSASTTFEDSQWAPCVTRGPLANVWASGTINAKAQLFPSTSYDGFVDDATVKASGRMGFVGYAIGSISDASTTSIGIFVNTMFA